MSCPKVSVIVPIYKVPEKFLRKCIESIMQQTLKDIEIILVDDGSPDICGDICDEYLCKDKRIKVIHKKNGGLCSARNAGFLVSSGEWITFVDGDDWIDKEMCKVMYSKGIEHDVQLVMCNFITDFKYKQFNANKILQDNKVYLNNECIFLQTQILNFKSGISSPCTKLIKRQLLLTNNIYHNEYLKQGAEGIDFNLKLFEIITKAIYIDKDYYHYVYNDTSITSAYSDKSYEYIIRCFKEIKNLIHSSKNKKYLLPLFYTRVQYAIVTSAISGFFHPKNKEKFSIKREKYKRFLKNDLINEALNKSYTKDLSSDRKFILWMSKHNIFIILPIVAYLRYWQKHL